MTAEENPLGQVVAKALQDEAFKARLIADPAATLAGEGVTLPEGTSVKVVEDTETVRHLVLPAPAATLSDADLDAVDGGQLSPCSVEGCINFEGCTTSEVFESTGCGPVY